MIPVVQIFEQRFRMIRKTEYFFHDGEKVLHNDGFNFLNGGYLFLYGKYFVFDRIFFLMRELLLCRGSFVSRMYFADPETSALYRTFVLGTESYVVYGASYFEQIAPWTWNVTLVAKL